MQINIFVMIVDHLELLINVKQSVLLYKHLSRRSLFHFHGIYIICETYKYLTFLYARIQMKKVNININGQCKSASVYSVSGGDTRENDGAVTRHSTLYYQKRGS